MAAGRGPALRTSRLVLVPVRPDDADGLLAFFNEPAVGRYLLDGRRVSRPWVESEIAASRARFIEEGLGLWAMRDAASSVPAGEDRATGAGAAGAVGERALIGVVEPALIGVVGFRPFFDPPELQLLYALHPDVWGRGLATEATEAALSYAFDERGLDEVRAATDEPNHRSVAVMERLGMERWKSEPGEPYETLFYRIGRAEWQGR